MLLPYGQFFHHVVHVELPATRRPGHDNVAGLLTDLAGSKPLGLERRARLLHAHHRRAVGGGNLAAVMGREIAAENRARGRGRVAELAHRFRNRLPALAARAVLAAFLLAHPLRALLREVVGLFVYAVMRYHRSAAAGIGG